MVISHVIYSQRHSSRLLLLLVLYHLCITGDQQYVKHIPLGGILDLLPDTTSVNETITGILWKHGLNKVAEWDQVFGPDVDYYGTFKHCTTLNKGTGELVINNVTIRDGGIYSVEINGRRQSKTHYIKVIRHILVKAVGEDVVLPCEVDPTTDPTIDLTDLTIKWTRPDDQYVYYQRNGGELVEAKGPSYVRRTSLFQDEVKKGNVSLKLTRVKPSDEGIYICNLPEFNKESTVHLTVVFLESSSVEPLPWWGWIIINIIIIIITIIIIISVLFYKRRSILLYIRFHLMNTIPPDDKNRSNPNEMI